MLRHLGMLAVMLGVFGVSQAFAQSEPTPEGTVITNTATVSFTDENNNPYQPLSTSVSVTVGFAPGVDLVANVTSLTPEAPSTDNQIRFTIYNRGNGVDTVRVIDEVISNPGMITNVRYQFKGNTYASLAALNAALATTQVPAGGSIEVLVLFDIASGTGGLSGTYEMTIASVRDPSKTDSEAVDIAPPMTGTIAVTPDGEQEIEVLPSNGVQYTAVFMVENQQNGTDSMTVVASSSGSAVITIVSVNGVPGTSASLDNVPAGAQVAVNVVYTIDNNAVAGAQDTLVLTVTSKTNAAVSDDGFVDVMVVRPALSIVKEAFRDDGVTPIAASDRVVPGEFIRYRVTVTNVGSANAVNVSVDDDIATQLALISVESDIAGADEWSFDAAGSTITASLPVPLEPGASRHFWIRVQIK